MAATGSSTICPDPIVDMRGIRKSFGSTEVLCGVDFDVFPGEVHVLAGENGAGKSQEIMTPESVGGGRNVNPS